MALTSRGKTRQCVPTRSWTPQPLTGWRLLGLLALVGLSFGGLVVQTEAFDIARVIV
jgi:hypothetical protein